MRIILDISSNTTKNDDDYVKLMLDELKKVDTGKHEIIIKGQLFQEAGKNIVMTQKHFDFMYQYSHKLGYDCTASVFDKESLAFLLSYEVPFIKIANNPDLYWLIDEIPRGIEVYVSSDNRGYLPTHGQYTILNCMSLYPATIENYNVAYRRLNTSSAFGREHHYPYTVSDHTSGLELVKEYKPNIWEKHYKLKDSTGLDAGTWAITPEELAEIL